MQLNPLIIIPVRLASTRLPRKALAQIHGKPMIFHVWEKAMKSSLGPVVIACGDQEIVDEVLEFGGEAILTDPALPSGTDRIKVAADIFDPKGEYNSIINVQGDLPTLDPFLLHEVLEPLKKEDVDISTIATLIQNHNELQNENIVKTVLSLGEGGNIGRALYFSRLPVPFGKGPHFHHVGLYAYKRKALNTFVDLPINPLETTEKLEQLRALAHGMRIDVKIIEKSAPFGVDTQEDLEKAIRIVGESYAL